MATDVHGYTEEQYAAARAAFRLEYPHYFTWHYRLLHNAGPWCWNKIPSPIRTVLKVVGFLYLLACSNSWSDVAAGDTVSLVDLPLRLIFGR